MRVVKRIGKILSVIIIIAIGIVVLSIITLVIHLNSFNPEIINTSLVKGRSLVFTESGRRVNIHIKEYIPIPLSKIPKLLQGKYMDKNVSEQCQIGWKQIIGHIFIDISEMFGTIWYHDPVPCQVVAHNALIIQNRSYPFKAEETALARKICQRYSEKEIYECYLNQLYFGHGVFGYEAAAHYYYDKSITEIQPYQLASLIGIATNYYTYSMVDNSLDCRSFMIRRAERIRNVVLDSMVIQKIISKKEAEEYKRKPLDIK